MNSDSNLSNLQKPCTRCLLEEAGNRDMVQLIKEHLEKIHEKDRVDKATYESRLDHCRQCDNLYQGTCNKCGCYVELRAAVKNNHCPATKRLW